VGGEGYYVEVEKEGQQFEGASSGCPLLVFTITFTEPDSLIPITDLMWGEDEDRIRFRFQYTHRKGAVLLTIQPFIPLHI